MTNVQTAITVRDFVHQLMETFEAVAPLYVVAENDSHQISEIALKKDEHGRALLEVRIAG